MSDYHFFALMSRMKYIERWSLMRNDRRESVGEHSLEVAMIAHALCMIGNSRFGKELDAERAAVIGIFHDASEIITGDMPTPVKYYNREIKEAYKQVEAVSVQQLLSHLPEDLRAGYADIFFSQSEEDAYLYGLVKAADKISALIKCMEEETSGNGEFRTAKKTLLATLKRLRGDYPEADVFLKEFLPSYGKTLDELLNRKDDGSSD